MPVNEPALQRHQENGFLHFILHTEASLKRGLTGLMAPLMGAIMDTMLRQMQLVTFSLLVGIETTTGNPDSYTVKYSPAGDLLWENTYTGSATGTDYGYALTLDPSGNVYVAGFGNGTNPATFDIFVLKYDADGNSVWTQRWTSPITNYSAYAYSIAVDNQGNVFTTGFESDGFTDGEFITLKFNSSGVLQWATPYNGSTSSIDYANHIVVDSDGNSYVTGWSGGANNLHDMTTIKYDPNGNELWVKRYNGSADDNDYAYWLALDGSGNVCMLPVKAWKPVLTMISPRSNTLRMEMRFGFGITMARPMVMTQAKPSLSMPMATPTSQVITL